MEERSLHVVSAFGVIQWSILLGWFLRHKYFVLGVELVFGCQGLNVCIATDYNAEFEGFLRCYLQKLIFPPLFFELRSNQKLRVVSFC